MKVTVLGAGSFGTSLAKLLAENQHQVQVWSHTEETANTINEKHENTKYLPGFELPLNLTATSELEKSFKQAELVLSAIPTQATRSVLDQCKGMIEQKTPVVACSKGIEQGTHKLVCDIFLDVLGEEYKDNLYFLSGPSFAKEIASRIPTLVTIASYNQEDTTKIQEAFRSEYFMPFASHDVVGIELAGALKNVIAIACGISDGLGLGHNTRAAIITRGLNEIARLGKAMGADPLTFMGLAGMGDLVLTCTGDLSRNRTVGLRLGEGMALKKVLDNMNQVAEGVTTTQSSYELAQEKQTEMPIADQVYKILYEDKTPKAAMTDLMKRIPKIERV